MGKRLHSAGQLSMNDHCSSPSCLLQPFGDGEDMLPNRAGGERVIDRQHIL